MVENEDGAAIRIGKITQAINNVTSVALHHVHVHTSKASSEAVNHHEQRAFFPHVFFKLSHVGKAPGFPKFNGARSKGSVLIANNGKLFAGINERLVTLTNERFALHATASAPFSAKANIERPVVCNC